MGNMGTDGTFPRFSSTRKQGAPAWEPPSQLLAVHLSGATIDAGLRPRGIVWTILDPAVCRCGCTDGSP